MSHSNQAPSYEMTNLSRALRLSRGTLLAFAMVQAPSLGLAAGRQLPLPSIDQLPNAPVTYHMRDWRQVAVNFDNLAFDTAASGQFLPLVRIDNTPESPQLQTSFGLAAYVGETRTFGENGEPVHEALASLGAVLGGTLVDVDKTTGPYNWVSMAQEYYVNRNSQYVILNTPFSVSGQSAWYETYPNILFYSIADRYPGESSLQTILDTVDSRFYDAVDVLTAGGTSPNFNYTAYDFRNRQPVYNGIWREPDMGLGMAWLQHAAYWRKRDSDPTAAALHLQAVDWALSYYENRSTNPNYEILTSFGAYTAARMNAEHGGNYNVPKYLDWVFSRSAARPDLVMVSGEQWGGEDVGGLLGTVRPNTSNPVQGYAFAMNTYANAMPVVALARYEDRYSRAIGKWMLNAANAAHLFYGDAHPPGNQSSEFWTGDPQHSIAYEGLRHHWLPPNLLGPDENEEIYAAGDPLTYGWGPLTDFGIYGAAVTGVFGSIIKTTNVDKILQLDLLATDFYHDAAHSTYLYYNPLGTAQSVAIDLGGGSPLDLYDAVSNRYLVRNATSQTFFDVPADEAVMLVLVPSGGTESRQGRRLLVDGVVIDYNASLLPDNLVRNPDVDSAHAGNPDRPAYWHYSSGATWSADEALSPIHSLELIDNNTNGAEEWRSYATAIVAGENRSLQVRWFWKYDIEAGDEFHARLRLSEDEVTSLDLTNPLVELNFTVSGTAADFEMFETTFGIPNGVQSFDLTFISGGTPGAIGAIYIDDVSASIIWSVISGDFDNNGDYDCGDIDSLVAEVVAMTNSPSFDLTGDGSVNLNDVNAWLAEAGAHENPSGHPYLTGDANLDGVVDGQDFIVWNEHKFTNLAAWCSGDFNADGVVDGQDFILWNDQKFTSSDHASAVPEPSADVLLFAAVICPGFARRRQ